MVEGGKDLALVGLLNAFKRCVAVQSELPSTSGVLGQRLAHKVFESGAHLSDRLHLIGPSNETTRSHTSLYLDHTGRPKEPSQWMSS